MECALENALILIHNKKISTMRDLLPLLEQIAKSGKALLIIAKDINGNPMATLVVNKLRGTLLCCAGKTRTIANRWQGPGK